MYTVSFPTYLVFRYYLPIKYKLTFCKFKYKFRSTCISASTDASAVDLEPEINRNSFCLSLAQSCQGLHKKDVYISTRISYGTTMIRSWKFTLSLWIKDLNLPMFVFQWLSSSTSACYNVNTKKLLLKQILCISLFENLRIWPGGVCRNAYPISRRLCCPTWQWARRTAAKRDPHTGSLALATLPAEWERYSG